MNFEDQQRIQAYLEQYRDVFNDMMQEVAKRIVNDPTSHELESVDIPKVSAETLAQKVSIDPQKFIEQQQTYVMRQQMLWQNATRALMGDSFEPVASVERSDKRFSDKDWEHNPVFNYIKQAYLLNAEYINQFVDAMQFEDAKVEEQVRFYTRQYVNMMSPTNYVLTNPEVCREILSSEGENLAKGIDNFVRDLKRSPNEAFKITQVRESAFTLGQDLATTKGEIVFQNSLFELIQYAPTTKQVAAIPLLVVPPFINKFYILDLNRKKSLVAWLVDQGYTVFMMSWCNPDGSLADMPFDHYVTEGVLTAAETIQAICKQKQIQAVGYCVGGTVLGMAAACAEHNKQATFASLSFLTTLFDFSEPGEVGTYLTQQLLPLVEKSVKDNGYLDGRILGLGFSLLRENNLFWSFFIEHYLKGKDPMPFDILYWNSDSTNMPATAFLYYLHNMYMRNSLKSPGALKVEGAAIDLGAISVPCYFLAAQSDHIVLWQAAHKSAQCLKAPRRFVMTESGHVAGVVNPPSADKYPHWVAESLYDSPDEWLKNASQVPGSWWRDWCGWLEDQGDEEKVKARVPGALKRFPSMGEAPGRYVRRRLDVDLP